MFKNYKEMMHLLNTYEEEIFQKCNASISKMSQSLGRSLITRDAERGTLRVNFSRDLMSVLKEVRHLKEFPSKAFPEVAGELFKRERTFRNYVNSLDQKVTHYNRLKTNTKPVECLLDMGRSPTSMPSWKGRSTRSTGTLTVVGLAVLGIASKAGMEMSSLSESCK